jgi:hypothetical protein
VVDAFDGVALRARAVPGPSGAGVAAGSGTAGSGIG